MNRTINTPVSNLLSRRINPRFSLQFSQLRTMSVQEYDLAVIGGGSGGMAAAKEAAKHGAKVVLFDYVKPSTQGSTWGLGGTCVNVGCVPKKLMHYAANIGAINHLDASKYGWVFPEKPSHNWETLVETVQNHIGSLNFGYRNGLRSNSVTYINAHATFANNATLDYTLRGKPNQISAKNILIATGGRPIIPSDVPGAVECAISSDDLFSLPETPGKTLVVGASYIALECAGFLTELGYDTTVAVRSILLRGFDRDCADKIGEMMKNLGTQFRQAIPSSMKKLESGEIEVTFSDNSVDTYKTVMYATGRFADTKGLKLEAAGLNVQSNGKFVTDDVEQTNVENIYAIGDILEGRPELTPVAIKTGELLARRLFAGAKAKMDWDLIPTTVFTPVEYGAVGLSEEMAQEKYGSENIETYLFEFSTLEHAAAHREKHERMRTDEYDVDMPLSCLAKLVCLKNEDERVVGFHFVGPNAGEMTQGYALALRLGARKSDFDNCVGIHPTDAEAFMALTVTRSSGESYAAAGGCGGGKCG